MKAQNGGKRLPARTVGVQKTDIAVQSDGFQRSGAVVRQQGIGERQQCVARVERRTARASGERKHVFVVENQPVKYIEIDGRTCAFQSAQRA